VSPVVQETLAKMENQVTLVLLVFPVPLVVHRWSAKNPIRHLAILALLDLQAQLVPVDLPETPVTMDQLDIQETLDP